MTATMPAYRLLEWGRAGFDEVPVPEPAYGEVLAIGVHSRGLCHWCERPPRVGKDAAAEVRVAVVGGRLRGRAVITPK